MENVITRADQRLVTKRKFSELTGLSVGTINMYIGNGGLKAFNVYVGRLLMGRLDLLLDEIERLGRAKYVHPASD